MKTDPNAELRESPKRAQSLSEALQDRRPRYGEYNQFAVFGFYFSVPLR